MAYTPDYGTGFEMGTIPIIAGYYHATQTYVTNSFPKTGVYCLFIRGSSTGTGYARWDEPSGVYLDFAAWVRPGGTSGYPTTIRLVFDDASTIELNYESGYWVLYVDEVEVETGTIYNPEQQYHHIQFRLFADNSGTFQTKVNGMDDIDYSGDTLPGSATGLSYMQLLQSGSVSAIDTRFDDLTFGTGGWPGDIRFDKLAPNADDTAEWTPSTGSDNYALVDEVPASDSDYVTGGSVPTVIDVYDMSDWSGTGKLPSFLVTWARAKKDAAGTIALNMGVESNGTQDLDTKDLNTNYEYRYYLVPLNPDGDVAWDDAAIDAVQLVIQTT